MPARPFRLPVDRRHLGLAAATLVLVACGSSAATGSPASAPPSPSAAGSGAPSNPPSASPAASIDGIDHASGATDVVLRVEQGGGFVPIDFLASQAPIFTLYGNGVVVFQPKVETFPGPDASGAIHGVPWRTAKLDEGQIQDLLEFALGAGGLGSARDSYSADNIADAPNTIFSVRAGGLDKTVVVNALGIEGVKTDPAARGQFQKLYDRLSDFDAGGRVPTDEYVADRYRVALTEREVQPGDHPIAWPWPAVKISDFTPPANDGSGLALAHRVATQADIDALGIKDTTGGLQNVVVKGPDGKMYGLIIRPLLVDEKD